MFFLGFVMKMTWLMLLLYNEQGLKDLIYMDCTPAKLNKRFNSYKYDVQHNNVPSTEFVEHFITND